jgi:hypothetical protein
VFTAFGFGAKKNRAGGALSPNNSPKKLIPWGTVAKIRQGQILEKNPAAKLRPNAQALH